MTRVWTVLAVLLTVAPAWAQGPDRDWGGRWERARERRQQRIERMTGNIDRDGVHLRIMRSYSLAEGETAHEPVVVIGGSARIDGHAEDDVVVVGGGLHLGPRAVVDGNVVTIGGAIRRDPAAIVRGSIDEAVVPWPSITFDPEWSGVWWTGVAFWGAFIRLSFVAVVAVLLTLVAPGWIGAISDRSAGPSILTGLAAEVLFIPALVIVMVALTVSIIGIPLLAGIPFLLAAFGILWMAGFTAVAIRVGRALRGRAGFAGASVSDFLLGYAAIIAVTVVGHLLAVGLGWVGPVAWPVRSVGLVIEYVAWTIGLGAAIISLVGGPRSLPPPVPA